MSKLLCSNCKTELTVSNIKGIKSVDVVTGLALVECKNCGSVTETPNSLAFEYKEYEQLQEMEKIHSFEELDYLLKELSVTDREKVKHYKFKLSKQYPDDDSGDVYYDITVFKDDTEIGNIDMEYHSNTWFNVATGEHVVNEGQKSYYTYTMKLDETLLSIYDLGIEEYLTEEQKEQLRFFKFKHLININDNDEDLDTGSFGDKYHIINMYGFCVGMLAISDYGTTAVDIELNEELNDDDTEDDGKHYIECPKCHNKILRNYWLNVKCTEHINYGDYGEDIYNGECPICGEIIETDELQLCVNSMEAEETELNQYHNSYNSKGDTPIMLSKSRTDGFDTPVCKKCGQLFCDCSLRCKVCGQLFCTHKR